MTGSTQLFAQETSVQHLDSSRFTEETGRFDLRNIELFCNYKETKDELKEETDEDDEGRSLQSHDAQVTHT